MIHQVVVEEIPEGKVASYGQIAELIGKDKNARLVGKVLGMAEYYGDYPCHRAQNEFRCFCINMAFSPFVHQ